MRCPSLQSSTALGAPPVIGRSNTENILIKTSSEWDISRDPKRDACNRCIFTASLETLGRVTGRPPRRIGLMPPTSTSWRRPGEMTLVEPGKRGSKVEDAKETWATWRYLNWIFMDFGEVLAVLELSFFMDLLFGFDRLRLHRRFFLLHLPGFRSHKQLFHRKQTWNNWFSFFQSHPMPRVLAEPPPWSSPHYCLRLFPHLPFRPKETTWLLGT